MLPSLISGPRFAGYLVFLDSGKENSIDKKSVMETEGKREEGEGIGGRSN